MTFYIEFSAEICYAFLMPAPFIYSEDFSAILRPDLKGWCLHLICLKGTGGFVYNGALYAIKKNDIVIAPHPEKITSADCGDSLKVSFVYGDLKFINAQLPQNHYGIKGEHSLYAEPVIHGTAKEIELLRSDFLNIKRRLEQPDIFYFRESLGAASLQMNYDLFEAHRRRDKKLGTGSEIPQGAASVVKRLTDILASGETLTHRKPSYYADRLNVSEKYLSETVKRLTGNSVTYLINRYSGQIIASLLRDASLSVTQISYRMGFASISYFSRYTKRVLGVSPAEFRRKM